MTVDPGVAAAAWLLGLWYAAGQFDRASPSWATRIRNGVLLGVAIPLVLATIGLLTAPLSWLLLAILAARKRLRANHFVKIDRAPETMNRRVGRALPILAVIAVAWPPLVRPLLQGDSLGYHLPNAASWSHDHTLWITNTTYWWYPGGSEMFAAGLYSVAGPFAVELSGTVALLLLAIRLYEFGERRHLDSLVSGGLSAVAVTTAVTALQSANLENDVWLSAFALELIWCIQFERGALAANASMCGLLKPFGAIFALCGLVSGRASLRTSALAMTPLGLWVVRDLVLWRNAIVQPDGAAFPHLERTTIAAQGLEGLRTLIAAIAHQDVGLWIIFVYAVLAPFRSRDAPTRVLTAIGLIFFLLAPFGFRNDTSQLSTGNSLRYALPGLIVGFSSAFGPSFVPNRLRAAIFILVALIQAASMYKIFMNDMMVFTIPIALVFAVPLLLRTPCDRFRSSTTALAATILIALCIHLANVHPIDYYNDWLGSNEKPSGFFTYIAKAKISRLVVWQMRQGAINIVAPQIETFDIQLGSDPCLEATRLGANLLVSDDPQTTPEALRDRRARARACGTVRYQDRSTLLVSPGDLARYP